jgi:circadian clock protein KaiB
MKGHAHDLAPGTIHNLPVSPALLPDPEWDFRLYVAGQTVRSLRAIGNLQRICATSLGHTYRIEIIDLAENPALAREHDIVALPTLVRRVPEPLRRIIGDLTDDDRVLEALEVVRVPAIPS